MPPDFERADRIGEFWSYRRAAPCRALDRVRGKPHAAGGAGRDVAGGWL